jgi:2,3-bisphosphoglycerate-independent phosphoglycerate mutase
MKYIIIVGDGMADLPLHELDDRTPLEAASTPNMDYIAENGVCGMVKHFYKGLPLDSGVANLSILGYNPRKYYLGRGPLEAVNIGVKLKPGDIAMRFNFVTVVDGRLVDPFSGHITNEETSELIEALRKTLGGEGIEFYPGVSYRNLLVLRAGTGHSLDFECTPPHDITGRDIHKYFVKAKSGEGKATTAVLNNMMLESKQILEEHPVNKKRIEKGKTPGNMMWVWGAGVKSKIPSFRDKHGFTGSLISAVDLLKGIGKEIGLDVIDVPGATGYIDTNYKGKADAAVSSLKDRDFTFVHVESPDESGHEGIIEHKIKAIEDLDKLVVGRMLDRLGDDFRLAVTADHPTPIEVRKHTDAPVPFAIYDTRGREKDGVEKYCEREVKANGSLGLIKGYKFIDLLVKSS